MSEEHLRGYSSLSLLPDPKRKRTPSQYAAQIADFKSVSIHQYRTITPCPEKQRLSDS